MVDMEGSTSVVGKSLVYKLRIWNRVRIVTVRQGDGRFLRQNLLVNTSSKVMDSTSVKGKFEMNAEALNIGNRDMILGLSWLRESGFSVDTQIRCLRNIRTGQLISYSIRQISLLVIIEEKIMEDYKILQIFDSSKKYSLPTQYLSTEQAVRLPVHKSQNSQIPFHNQQITIHMGVMYKNT